MRPDQTRACAARPSTACPDRVTVRAFPTSLSSSRRYTAAAFLQRPTVLSRVARGTVRDRSRMCVLTLDAISSTVASMATIGAPALSAISIARVGFGVET